MKIDNYITILQKDGETIDQPKKLLISNDESRRNFKTVIIEMPGVPSIRVSAEELLRAVQNVLNS